MKKGYHRLSRSCRIYRNISTRSQFLYNRIILGVQQRNQTAVRFACATHTSRSIAHCRHFRSPANISMQKILKWYRRTNVGMALHLSSGIFFQIISKNNNILRVDFTFSQIVFTKNASCQTQASVKTNRAMTFRATTKARRLSPVHNFVRKCIDKYRSRDIAFKVIGFWNRVHGAAAFNPSELIA